MEDAVKKYPDVDVLVNFASLRSAYDATIDAIQHKQVQPPLWFSCSLHVFSYNNLKYSLCSSAQLL